jgi:transcriptional regulator with XRE-family HTH domain
MKRNPQLIERIRKKAKEGIPMKEIAKELGISQTTVIYWANDEYRKKTKKKANEISTKLYKEGKLWCQLNPEKYKAWFRKYQKDRYENDTEYRERIKESNRKRMAKIRNNKGI